MKYEGSVMPQTYCHVVLGPRNILPYNTPSMNSSKPEQNVYFLVMLKGVFLTRWRHQMGTFSALLALCAGNSQVTGQSWIIVRPEHSSWHRADSRCAPSQWEKTLLCNDASHWLGASLESAVWHAMCRPRFECIFFKEVSMFYSTSTQTYFQVFNGQ